MKVRTRIAAAAVALAAAATIGGLAAAAPAMACAAPQNCTNGTLAVGATIGTTGFPTAFSMTGNAGTTANATATAYSVFANTTWTLSFSSDSTDLVSGSNFPAEWYVSPPTAPPVAFSIPATTTISHAGSMTGTGPGGSFQLPNANGVTSVQIDAGGATGGGQGFTDSFHVAIPTTAAPGQYVAAFQYVLAGS